MTFIRSCGVIAVCVLLSGGLAERALAQVDLEALSVAGQVTTKPINGVREETLTLNAEFVLGAQSDGILPAVEDIILRGEVAGGRVPDWFIVGIPAGTLMESGKNRWTAIFTDTEAIRESQIKMGIERADQTFDDLIPNTAYIEVTLKQKGQSWALEIETTAYFEGGVPDWFIVGSTGLTELTIGDDGGIRESDFVGYGGGISH